MAGLAPKVQPAKQHNIPAQYVLHEENRVVQLPRALWTWEMWNTTKQMPSPQNLPAPPCPAAKLGCLGGSAGGSEGLETPSRAEGRGQGLRGITSPFGRARQELPWQGAVKGGHMPHIERHNCPQTPTWIWAGGLTTFCHPSWTWESEKSIFATGKLECFHKVQGSQLNTKRCLSLFTASILSSTLGHQDLWVQLKTLPPELLLAVSDSGAEPFQKAINSCAISLTSW